MFWTVLSYTSLCYNNLVVLGVECWINRNLLYELTVFSLYSIWGWLHNTFQTVFSKDIILEYNDDLIQTFLFPSWSIFLSMSMSVDPRTSLVVTYITEINTKVMMIALKLKILMKLEILFVLSSVSEIPSVPETNEDSRRNQNIFYWEL